MLVELIRLAQGGDNESLLALREKFTPLIKKYSYLIKNDDAYEDLTLNFILLIHDIKINKLKNTSDGALVNYIATSIKFAYISLSKKQSHQTTNTMFIDDLSDTKKARLSTNSLSLDEMVCQNSLFESSVIDENERKILKLIYIQGYSVAEIARILNVSRQAINQTKQRAFRKLKKMLQEV